MLYCCFCQEDAGEYGNDPSPLLESGRCCDRCNLTVVLKARIERSVQNEEEYTCEEEVDDRPYAQEEENEAEALLREATNAYHQNALEEAMTAHSKVFECTICQDAIEPFDHRKCQGLIPYDCTECHDYYDDHRPCEGMTRSEIAYEDYCDNQIRNGRSW